MQIYYIKNVNAFLTFLINTNKEVLNTLLLNRLISIKLLQAEVSDRPNTSNYMIYNG